MKNNTEEEESLVLLFQRAGKQRPGLRSRLRADSRHKQAVEMYQLLGQDR